MIPVPTVFTQPGCQPCRAVKRWLGDRDIAFSEVNIAESPEDLEFIKGLGYMQAPVVAYEVDGETKHFGGFNPYELEDLQKHQDALLAA